MEKVIRNLSAASSDEINPQLCESSHTSVITDSVCSALQSMIS